MKLYIPPKILKDTLIKHFKFIKNSLITNEQTTVENFIKSIKNS